MLLQQMCIICTYAGVALLSARVCCSPSSSSNSITAAAKALAAAARAAATAATATAAAAVTAERAGLPTVNPAAAQQRKQRPSE